MSVHFQVASMGSELVMRHEMEERHRRARATELVREAKDRSGRRLSLPSPRLPRLVSAIGMAPRALVTALAR